MLSWEGGRLLGLPEHLWLNIASPASRLKFKLRTFTAGITNHTASFESSVFLDLHRFLRLAFGTAMCHS